MRSSVPLTNKKKQTYNVKQDFYDTAFESECHTCWDTCVKPRQLPCEHNFCKACLKEYFSKEIEDDVATNCFPCPVCNKPVDKPLAPKSKWTKAFKVKLENPRSTFYSAPAIEQRSSCPLDQFGCKINSEHFPCAFWGGDVCPSGKLFLPDWYNNVIKVFTEKGQLLARGKFTDPPLDVTVLPGNTCVVSYGRVNNWVTLLEYENRKFTNRRNVKMDGYMYNTTRLGQRCLGIMERKDGTVALVTISNKHNVKPLNLHALSSSVSSESGICYDISTTRIYLTVKNKLICITKTTTGGKLLFEKSYPRFGRETDTYRLGAVACDHQGSVYVASDNCVLHLDTDGRFQEPKRTALDPYHVMVSTDSQTLFLVGRSDRVETCSAELRASTEA